MQRFQTTLALLLTSTLLLTNLAAQDAKPKKAPAKKPPKPTYTDYDSVPEDFWLQGEYFGSAKISTSSPRQKLGLQVIDLGDDNFQAAIYLGGLPGEGWNQQSPTRLDGKLLNHQLTFASDSYLITVENQSATFSPLNQSMPTSQTDWGSLKRIARVSPTMGLKPPVQAQILFDGKSTQHFEDAKISDQQLLKVGALTRDSFNDFRLHLEFKLPFKPTSSDQERGNSGVYIQQRYELQILDSFGLDPVFNSCGALYRQQPADLNMSLPPLTWQTYDIWFTAPRFNNAGEKIENARITAWHNGIPIHSNRDILTSTGKGKPESPDPMPILLQDHQNPVVFRNIWILRGQIQPPSAPISSSPARIITTTPPTTQIPAPMYYHHEVYDHGIIPPQPLAPPPVRYQTLWPNFD